MAEVSYLVCCSTITRRIVCSCSLVIAPVRTKQLSTPIATLGLTWLLEHGTELLSRHHLSTTTLVNHLLINNGLQTPLDTGGRQRDHLYVPSRRAQTARSSAGQ